MKKLSVVAVVLFGLLMQPATAQRGPGGAPSSGSRPSDSTQMNASPKGPTDITLPANSAIVTKHEVTIKGAKVPYTATTGTQPVWDASGKTIASVFYVFFERSDVKDKANRPLIISFNGGPGTASVWMNIGFTGPQRLMIDNEGFPVQPYGMRENPYSILDVADIIFVDPVNTGFSRILDPKTPTSTFFGVNADIKYLAEWINAFLSRTSRWASPKYLIGESYGTTRVSGLAQALQSTQWIYLNGVILVSPTDLGIMREGPVKEASFLPYYAATAWYHKALPSDLQSKDLEQLLPEVEKFTIEEYTPALMMAGTLPADKRDQIATKISRYSGIDKKVVLQNNLAIATSLFWKELLRDKGYTVGRLDSRYRGIDRAEAGIRTDYNSELTSWLHSFTPAINSYLRDDLGFKTDLKYHMFGPVHPWDRTNDNTGDNLSLAMHTNPNLHLLVLSGYYDGACDYFNAKYNMWHINRSGKLTDRMHFKGFRSGHMMYLREEDLRDSNEVLREFIKKSIPGKGVPAKF